MIGNDWDEKLNVIWNSEGFKKFWNFVMREYDEKDIFPAKENIFKALELTPYSKVKVVIVGQDPYHGIGQAHGLSFSVNDGVAIPKSLQNIYKELHDDLGIAIPSSGNLTKWALNGVLLLNDSLTVVKGQPASHSEIGWQRLTDYIIKLINLKEEPVVFILWGNNAQKKEELITNSQHFVIKSSHPSPFSAHKGFFGSKPFSKTNDYLILKKEPTVDWRL